MGTKVNPVAALKFALKRDLGTPTVVGAVKNDGSLVTTNINLSMIICLPKSPFWLANLVFVPCLAHPQSCPLLPVEEAVAQATQAGRPEFAGQRYNHV